MLGYYYIRYIKAKIVPRRPRWDVLLNDGLLDKESVDEWFYFFKDKGLELLKFPLKRKQKKIGKIDQIIGELKEQLEVYKDTAECIALTAQLNKDFTKK